MTDATPPPPPQLPAEKKKGLSPWAWVAIGCGALILLGFLSFVVLGAFIFKKGKDFVEEATDGGTLEDLAAQMEENPAKTSAEMMIRLNPDLELVETDDDAGTITFRNTKTGEEATLNFEDIAEGKFSIETDEGEFSVEADTTEGGMTFSGPEGETRIGSAGSLDDVPDWVPTYPKADSVQSTYSTRQGSTSTGLVIIATGDSVDTVADYFRDWFEDNGYEIAHESSSTTQGMRIGSLMAELAAANRTVTVGIAQESGQTQVTINYTAEGE